MGRMGKRRSLYHPLTTVDIIMMIEEDDDNDDDDDHDFNTQSS
jgi:hypothetical protein